jgi:predicted kinase
MRELYLLRGLPGAGKSTLAKSLGGKHFEADMFFTGPDGGYNFDISKLKEAHGSCRLGCEMEMKLGTERVVVSNTFTQEWELEPFLDFAKKYRYVVYSLIVENRHGGVNTHGVTEDKLTQMEDRFHIKLR